MDLLALEWDSLASGVVKDYKLGPPEKEGVLRYVDDRNLVSI